MVDSLMMSSTELKSQSDGHVDSANGSALVHRRIDFHPARKPFTGFINGSGDFRLETLNPSSDPRLPGSNPGQSGMNGKKADGSEVLENGLDPELSLGITVRRIGAGLQNLGNTCFLNSVLQCLTYTEPLAAYLQSGKHQNSCHIAGFCALCAIQKHVSRALQATGRILAPKDLVSNLRCISRNFRNARQEDAHEYMVNLLESMHKCCLPSGVPSESPSAYEKSLVHKIFGGRLRSQVKCMQCSYCSNTFDPFLDLSLEIAKAESLHKALLNFTAAELLDGGERQYQCQRCKQKVRALKQLTVHKAPYVLTIHLKRFRSHDPGQKIDKKVHFGPTLDMKPFVSGSYEGDLKYTLYGVLVHYGWSTHSGHYYCFVRTSSGMWYSLDDNQVVQVNERTVLEQKAYMLFYVRDRRNIAPRKPVDVVQKENLKANSSGNRTCSNFNQQLKEQTQKGPSENGLRGAYSSAAVTQKDAVDSSKENLVKEASFQQTNGQIIAKCSVTKKDPVFKPSSSAPLAKGLPKRPSLPNQDLGQCFPPSAPPVTSNGDTPNLENATNTTCAKVNDCNENRSSKKDLGVSVTISSSCNGLQNSSTEKVVTNESSQKINSVSNAGVSSIAPFEGASIEKTLERVSSVAPSGDSGDTMLEKIDPVRSPNKLNCENSQVGGTLNDSSAGNSLNERSSDSDQRMVRDLVQLSAQSAMANESLQTKAPDCAPHRKSKKKRKSRVTNMHIGLKLFRASLGLRKKKKHKRSKRHTQNLSKEHLSDKDCSSDLGPSTSEKSRTFSLNSTPSQNAANGTAPKNLRHCNGDLSINGLDGECGGRTFQNGAVLATDELLQKSSGSSLEANQRDAREHDGKRDASQNGMMNMLTRGLEETTVACWDGIELPRIVESNGTESISIGYVPDEWDEEYDRGKRKKLRLAQHSFGGPNPFQEIATKTTQLKKAKMDRSRSGNRPYRI